ncbi:ribonuclease III domain-containing protein [Cytidiella melzeri]|nr:ribonuclease III domain-containing protein [Cytidiella melzeri]
MPFIYRQIQDAIFRTIDKPSFSGALPPLSNNAWLKIVDSTRSKDENERLEFLGDALMYATLGRELYKRIPDGDPSIYTETRAALHSNATFSRLAEKLDILGVSRNVLDALTRRTFGEGSSAPLKTRSEIKATGDLFETVIGAYYLEHGFERLCEWVAELYAPLITTAQKAYLEHKPAKKRRLNLTGLRQAEVGSLPKKSRFHPSPIRRGPSKPYAPLSGSVNSRLSAAARSPLNYNPETAYSKSETRVHRLDGAW